MCNLHHNPINNINNRTNSQHKHQFISMINHNHNTIKKRILLSFQKQNDELGQWFCQMFFQNKGNQLQPTQGISSLPPDLMKAKTLSEFVSKFKRYLPVLFAMAEANVNGLPGKKILDMRARASRVSRLLQTGKYAKLRLMDGHGRMFMLICQDLIDNGQVTLLDNLQIEIVDISPTVNHYHTSLFRGDGCKNIKAINCDILKLPISSDTLIYLNFCGLAKSLEQVKEFTRKCGGSGVPFVLSYSGRNNNHESSLVPIVPSGFHFNKLETGRKNYITFVFERQLELLVHKKNPNYEEWTVPQLFAEWKARWLDGTQREFCSLNCIPESSFSNWKSKTSPYPNVRKAVIKFLQNTSA